MYLVVRSDLTPGEQLAQTTHAVFRFASRFPGTTDCWLDNSECLVILGIENEEKLLALWQEAERQGIECIGFREPDMDNQLTAICLEPDHRTKKLCQHLKLALR
jgi:peptidyl-tRNA hydrolase